MFHILQSAFYLMQFATIKQKCFRDVASKINQLFSSLPSFWPIVSSWERHNQGCAPKLLPVLSLAPGHPSLPLIGQRSWSSALKMASVLPPAVTRALCCSQPTNDPQ